MNVSAFDAIVPGLLTVMLAVPGWTRSEAGTVAVRVVESENTVLSAAPFQRTEAPLTKLAPVTVSVN